MAYLPQKSRAGFDGLLEWLLIGTTALVPIAFIPLLFAPFQFTKAFFIAIAALLGVAFYIVARMKERRILIPMSPLMGAMWMIPVAYLLSSLFSGNIEQSLLGQGFSTDSFAFVGVLTLLATLVAIGLRKRESLLKLYGAFMVSVGIVALFQIARLFFGPNFLSFGIFTSTTANVLGSWNDLAIFFGLVTVLSLVTLVGLTLHGKIKLIVAGALAVSIAMLIVINFSVVWWVIGAFALGTFVYSLTTGRYSRERATTDSLESESQMRELVGEGQTSFASLLVLSLCLVFLVGGNFIGNSVSTFFNVSQLEVRPSWQSTADVIQSTYAKHAIFGSGPGSFSREWLLNKPVEINQTLFWSADFASGIGYIPTSFATTGAVGALAWILFIGLFLYAGFRALVMRVNADPLSSYLSLSSYLGALFLWIFAVIYTPSHSILFFAFLLTGVFIASIRRQPGGFSEKEISFVENPRLGFISVLFLTLLFLGSIASIFAIGERYASAMYFQKGVVALNVDGDIDASEALVSQAVTLNEVDAYYRFGTNLNLIRLSEVAQSETLSEEEARTQFQAVLAAAIQNAQRATALDPTNYLNWINLAQVYQTVVPLKVEGAYDGATQAYARALEFNPQSPAIFLGLAQLESANGNNETAKEKIQLALEKKNNYTEAIFLLAQIQINEGETEEAIKSVEATTVIEPTNPVNFFQLGLLKYSDEQYEGASSALARAIALNPNYSNALYFLGLSEYERGDVDSAIEQFKKVQALNPDTAEINDILENLENGLPPISKDTSSSVESLDSLPVSEEPAATTEVLE